MSDYYNVTGAPSANSQGSSATMRAEFVAIADGISAKLPALTGNALKIVRVNSGASALEAITAASLATVLLDESWAKDDAANTGVTNVLTIGHTTTGTPGTGIGTGLAFSTETAAGNNETGMVLQAVTTDVSAGSEDFDFVLRLMAAGAAAAEKFRVSSTGVVTLQGALNTTSGGSLAGTWSTLGTVTTVDINGGTIDGATIGGASPGAGTFSTLTSASATITGGTVNGTVIGGVTPAAGTFSTLASPSVSLTGGTLSGITSISTSSLTATTADINGGTVDGATINSSSIGVTTAAAGRFTTITATTNLTLASGATVTAILDEDTMSSNSATALATQQSIKAYVDSVVTSGTVTTANSPLTGEFAKFTSSTAIEGRTAAETRSDLGLVIGTNVQAYSSVLQNTTASFTTAQETKLSGIATGADVTGSNEAGSVEGTNVKSTGEIGGTKFLREDGDGTCSWQSLPGGGDAVTTNPLSQFAATTSAQLAGVISDETGSGALVFATSPTLVTPALGTPSSGTLTNCTGLPIGGVTGLGTGVATFLATPSSTNLRSAVTDETGTGSLVFATSPTLVTPNIGTPSAGTLTNCTGLPVSGLNGVTSSAAELNILDGVTATATQLNYLAGATGTTGTNNLVYGTSPTINGATLTDAAITLVGKATTDNTTSGSLQYDTDDFRIAIGDGVDQRFFINTEGVTGDISMTATGTVSISSGVIVNADINASAAIAATKIADGSVDNTEFQYLNGVTSAIQTQLNNKQPLDSDLTAIAALTPTDGSFIVGNGSAWVAESGNTAIASLGITATATELNYNDITTLGTVQASKVVTADANGDTNYADNSIKRAVFVDCATEFTDLGSGSGTRTFDLSTAQAWKVTVATSANTFSFTNPSPSGTECVVVVEVVNGGSQVVTHPTGTDWAAGVAPTLTAAGTDILVYRTTDGGTTWFASVYALDIK